MNFSKIANRSLTGKLLRIPLRMIPRNTIMPILQGRLRGRKWIVGSGNHGCWLGSYECEKQRLLSKVIREGSVVYDIGAHAGFYTLLASAIVGSKGRVIAFEPQPRNIDYLKKHIQLNRCGNVTVFEAAVAEKSGIAYFEEGDSYIGRLSSSGRLKVKTVCLDEHVSQGKIPVPEYMKIDVEGAEANVLAGAKSILEEYSPTIFLATHGKEIHRKCCDLLSAAGYELQSIAGKDITETDEIMAIRKRHG